MWAKKTTVHNVTVIADLEQVDAAVEKIEAATRKMEAARSSLLQTISEAKRARGELEASIVKSRRRGRTW